MDPATAQHNSPFDQKSDSSFQKSSKEWKDEKATLYFHKLGSQKKMEPDTLLGDFHRFYLHQPAWSRNLGNYGTALQNLYFDPALSIGTSLGMHVYDGYSYAIDDLLLYNTTRPYSEFTFVVGSKNEQHVSIMHTQNINPLWNFSFGLRYATSDGYFKQQKSNGITGDISTQYQSKNKKYYMVAGFVYNKFKQEENGGIVSDTFLNNPLYFDRTLIDVAIPPNDGSPSAVDNYFRNYDFLLQNNYSFGVTDTTYNEDSTRRFELFTPRFRLKHELRLHGDQQRFIDRSPDSLRYLFAGSYLFEPRDSVYAIRSWSYVDNKVSLNGFLGKREHLLALEAGLGSRVDRLSTEAGDFSDNGASTVNNYVFGELQKEALGKGAWGYKAAARFYFTGEALGNFSVQGQAGKNLGNWAQLSVFFEQQLGNAPYTWSTFITNRFRKDFEWGKMGQTYMGGQVYMSKYKVQITASNRLLSNYLYYDSTLMPIQSQQAFSVFQLQAKKGIEWGVFRSESEIAWQQATSSEPISLPGIMVRQRIGIETHLFQKSLSIATGFDITYTSPYESNGYSPYLNQFYRQKSQRLKQIPECRAYFNFKIKSFRAFAMVDQLQQFVSENVLYAPGYPTTDALFRFGFKWILVN